MLRLILLGGLRLEDDAEPFEGRAAQKRRLALLSLLAVPPGHLVSRDKLIGYLWPERDDDKARRLLSTALYDLRRELGEEVIRTPGDEVRLDPSVISSDAAAFMEAIEAGELERAVDIYGGPFLDGAYPADSVEFEHWADAERRRYARLYRDALEQLALAREREGQPEEAVDFWRRLAVEDPCNTRVAAGYMSALAAVGERARALQFFGVYQALLREELDTDPDPEVLAIAERLRDPPATGPALDSASGGEAPIIVAEPVPHAGPPVSATPARDSAPELPAQPGGRAGDPERGAWPGPGRGSKRAPWHRGIIVGIGVAVALAGLALVLGQRTGEGPQVVRVAVLPLENQSGPDTEHFALGLTEEILLALAQVEGFRVPGPASSFAYRDRERRGDPRAVAQELGVDYLLSGSVRKDDERLRAALTLTDASTEFVLWSESYDSRSTGRLGVQEEIARAVVSELRPQLRGEGDGQGADKGNSEKMAGAMLARSTDDPQAHSHYLRARGLWYERSPEALRSALQELGQAVARDPDYARAYAGLADVYNIMGAYDYGLLAPSEAYPAAKEAAERALALEPRLPEAHAALGVALFNYDWDLPRAEQELTTALALNSGESMARHWYSLLLRVTGRDEEAMRQIEEAQERDPRSVVLASSLCRHHYFARRFERAREACVRALSLDPTHVQAHLAAGMVAVQQGRTDTALAAYRTARELLGVEGPLVVALEAHARAAAGDTSAARRLYRRLEEAEEGPDYVPPHFLAVAALAAGAEEEAAGWMEVALEQRSASLLYIAHEPVMDPLWWHPSLQRVVQRARGEGLGAAIDARDTTQFTPH